MLGKQKTEKTVFKEILLRKVSDRCICCVENREDVRDVIMNAMCSEQHNT